MTLLLGGAYLASGRPLAFLGIRHFSTYPPAWVGGVLGASASTLTVARWPSLAAAFRVSTEEILPLQVVGLVGLGLATALAVGALAHLSLSVPSRAQVGRLAPATPVPSLHLNSFPALREWLRDDTAIDSNEQDVFGYTRIARRIARRLLLPTPPAQAVLGDLGAGKTSLRKLVQAELGRAKGPRNVQIVPIETWVYDSSRVAVEGILAEIIDALATRVNVIGIRGLPGAYADAMSETSVLGTALVKLQGLPGTPREVLDHIDAVATAIGVRYVVWIEDLERFAGVPLAESGSAESPEEAERLGPIRALLAGLANLRSVTVVTATVSLERRFDLEKIARFVERLPGLPEDTVVGVLEAFRSGATSEHAFIDPAPGEGRALLSFPSTAVLAARRTLVGTRVTSIGAALPALISTPRRLKQSLRVCLDTWDVLRGEIDFDDLLTMSIVRIGSPSAFSLIEGSVHDLRKKAIGQRTIEDGAAWTQDLLANVPVFHERSAINEVVKFIFDEPARSKKPQGVARCDHTDYWRRLLEVPELDDAERDQHTLRIIDNLNSAGQEQDDDAIERARSALVAALMDPTRAAAVLTFHFRLRPQAALSLLVPLVETLAAASPGAWGVDGPPALTALWNVWLRIGGRELGAGLVRDRIVEAAEVAAPKHVVLLKDIARYFTEGGEVPDLMATDDGTLRQDARNQLYLALVRSYVDNPADLAERFRGAPTATLRHLCWDGEGLASHDLRVPPFMGWQAFAEVVLSAATAHADIMLPQIAWLVVSYTEMGRDNGRYDFDSDLASRLFKSADAVLTVAARGRSGDADDAALKALLRAAGKWRVSRSSSAAAPQGTP